MRAAGGRACRPLGARRAARGDCLLGGPPGETPRGRPSGRGLPAGSLSPRRYPLADEPAALEAEHPVRPAGEVARVRDRDHAAALLVGCPHEQVRDLLRGVLVEAARRLVAQQRPRVAAQRPGDGHALLLAAREREHAAPRVLGGDPHLLEERQRGQARGERHVLRRRQVVDEVVALEHEGDVLAAVPGEVAPPERRAGGRDHAGHGHVEAAQEREQRGLAAARRAHDRVHHPLLERGADAVEDLEPRARGVGVGHVAQLERGGAAPQGLRVLLHGLPP